MDKKFFGFDIDGTLVTKNNEILPNTIKTLKNIYDKGHIISLVTGRGLRQSISILEILEKNGIKAYLIANNGSLIKNGVKGENKFLGTINEKSSNWLIEKGRETKSLILLHYDGKTIYYIDNTEWLKEINKLSSGIKIYPEEICEYNELISATKSGKVNQVSIKQSLNIVNEAISNAPKHIREKNEVVIVGQVYFDICPKNITKFNSVLKLCEDHKIKRDNIYLFGDSLNDISMMRKDIHSVAMINALDPVKCAARYITMYDNNNEGVAHWINDNVIL